MDRLAAMETYVSVVEAGSFPAAGRRMALGQRAYPPATRSARPSAPHPLRAASTIRVISIRTCGGTSLRELTK
jgi:hypothetical protein